jgi:hypothetical protein
MGNSLSDVHGLKQEKNVQDFKLILSLLIVIMNLIISQRISPIYEKISMWDFIIPMVGVFLVREIIHRIYKLDSWSWINGRALSDYTYYTEEDLCEGRLPIEPRHRSCGILDRARRGRLCMNVDVCDKKLNFICEKGLLIKINFYHIYFSD